MVCKTYHRSHNTTTQHKSSAAQLGLLASAVAQGRMFLGSIQSKKHQMNKDQHKGPEQDPVQPIEPVALDPDTHISNLLHKDKPPALLPPVDQVPAGFEFGPQGVRCPTIEEVPDEDKPRCQPDNADKDKDNKVWDPAEDNKACLQAWMEEMEEATKQQIHGFGE